MQRLVRVADQVRQQQQGLAAVADAERRRRAPTAKHVDGGLQRTHHIVIIGADERAVVVVALDRDIGEVVLFVTSDLAPAEVALGRVAAHEVDHPGDALGRLEGLAGAVETGVGNVTPAVAVRLHILDAVGPCRRHLEFHAERACHLAGRARVQQAVGHGSAERVARGAERQHWLTVQQADQHHEYAARQTQSFTDLTCEGEAAPSE